VNTRAGLLPVLALGLWAQPDAEVRGRVLDGITGEGLGRVRVELADTPHRLETGPDGRFQFPLLAAGAYLLRVTTVGYYVEKRPFRLQAGDRPEFEVVLTPSSLRRRESVDVTVSPFDLERAESPSALTADPWLRASRARSVPGSHSWPAPAARCASWLPAAAQNARSGPHATSRKSGSPAAYRGLDQGSTPRQRLPYLPEDASYDIARLVVVP